MSVPVVCPECAKKLKAPDKARGKALKCPTCGGRVPVPADGGGIDAEVAEAPRRRKQARRKQPAKAAAGGGTGEFIAGLDLSRAEDRDTEVCPRCGTVVPDDEETVLEECPACGADLLTGGKGVTARRKERYKDRGDDPRAFYSKAPGDAWTFLKNNVGVAVRLSLLTLGSGLVAGACWVLIAYCAGVPTKLFYGLPAVVATLFIPGCLWVLQVAVTELTFEKKPKFKRFRFDVLDCVSNAPRMVVWAAVALWPLTILDGLALAAWPLMGTVIPLLVALGVHAAAAFLCWPAGLGHMAMPVSKPGWNFFTVAGGTGRNLGPVLFWAALTFAAFLPFLAAVGGTAALTGSRVSAALATMERNNAAYLAAAAEAAGKDNFKAPEGAEIDWMAFLIPGIAVLPLAFLFGFAAVYASRPAGLLARMFRPSLGLIMIAKEKKYVPKIKRRSELEELDYEEDNGLTWKGVGLIAGATLGIGLIVGFGYAMSADRVSIVGGMGVGLLYVSLLSSIFAGFTLIGLGFKESALWGIGMMLPMVNGVVQLIFLIMFWRDAKYVFVWSVSTSVLLVLSFVLMYAGETEPPWLPGAD